jgi:hypothetical protein
MHNLEGLSPVRSTPQLFLSEGPWGTFQILCRGLDVEFRAARQSLTF